MKIPVVGFDPSLRNWGIARGTLDLDTGYLEDLNLTVVRPKEMTGKQVRQNSNDLHIASQLCEEASLAARQAKVIFVEPPVGSQSARAMASYGICLGILGAIKALGNPLIEVTAFESKQCFTGNRLASKEEMIARAVELYPNANFPKYRGAITSNAEHVADAIAAIHAGVQTSVFQNLMRLLAEVK